MEWTEEKNQRRCELVDKEIDGTLTPEEASELEVLQREMLAYRRKMAPLPIQEAREDREVIVTAAATDTMTDEERGEMQKPKRWR